MVGRVNHNRKRLLDFLSRSRGGAVVIRKTEVEETQFPSHSINYKTPSPRARVFRDSGETKSLARTHSFCNRLLSSYSWSKSGRKTLHFMSPFSLAERAQQWRQVPHQNHSKTIMQTPSSRLHSIHYKRQLP